MNNQRVCLTIGVLFLLVSTCGATIIAALFTAKVAKRTGPAENARWP